MRNLVPKCYLALFLLLLSGMLLAAPVTRQCNGNTIFNVGAGIYDITGPAAEQGMMGYGMLAQKTNGIYQRLWARAFVIESPCNNHRVVFVNADLGQIFQGVKQQVIKKLKEKYGDRYSDDNVLLTATHTHSGPGGYSTYAFYNLTILGFSQENFDVITDGIVAAIERAQATMTPAHIKVATGELTSMTHNRSPEAYLLNPVEERNRYSADTDTQMTLIRFDSIQGKPIGAINWFPAHGTAVNNKNGLINGDIHGYAEYQFEKSMQTEEANFVAAFAQANSGDVSPNLYGHEGGEGAEAIKNVERVGKPLYEKAKQLYNNASEIVTGGVDYRHRYVDMGHVQVDPGYTDGKKHITCPAAIGVSMLAGTKDGEGYGWQGITCDTLHNALPAVVCEMTTTNCQGVKPIAVSTGGMLPYPLTPQILPMQVVKIGNLLIGAAPMELTTMTGRRIKNAINQQLPVSEKNHVVLSALSNAYAGYVATNEEYQLQRYEGASTHFGPWTSAALTQIFAELSTAVVNNTLVEAGPQPLDLINSPGNFNLVTGVVFDTVPFGKNFGDVYQNVNSRYKPGDTVEVTFWGAHPKNNYRTQNTFLDVQQRVNNKWVIVRTDQDWDTEYHWQRRGISESLVTIVWRIPENMPPGEYRIVHYGDWKFWWSRLVSPYTGFSATFTVQKS